VRQEGKKFLFEIVKEKEKFGEPAVERKILKWNFKEIQRGGVSCLQLVQDMAQRRVIVNTVKEKGYQPHQLVKHYKRFGNHLSLLHQGLM
jgi:hypothetical protein